MVDKTRSSTGRVRTSGTQKMPPKFMPESRGGFFVESGARNVLILLIVLLSSFIVLVYPVRNLVREQQHLAQLNEEYDRTVREKEYYEGEVKRWQDDKYIISHARTHYTLIMPGELAMHVADKPEVVGNDKDLNNFDDQRKVELAKEIKDANERYKTPWYEKISSAFMSDPQNNDQNNESPGEEPATSDPALDPDPTADPSEQLTAQPTEPVEGSSAE